MRPLRPAWRGGCKFHRAECLPQAIDDSIKLVVCLPSWLCHIPVIDLSYSCHKSAIFLPCSCHIHVILLFLVIYLSYSNNISVIYLSQICYISVIFLLYSYHTFCHIDVISLVYQSHCRVFVCACQSVGVMLLKFQVFAASGSSQGNN